MSADLFLDTNVIVYSFDQSEPGKQRIASEVIRRGDWQISWQVIQEFANVARHRFAKPLKTADLSDFIDLVLWPRCTVLPSDTLYKNALSLSDQTQYRFYDSLIVASALSSGATKLLSEDLQHGREFGDLRVENPFGSVD